VGLLTLFVRDPRDDGYLQAFGAPGNGEDQCRMVQSPRARPLFGNFGFMINAGQVRHLHARARIAGRVYGAGLLTVPPLHWRWLFWTPACICAVVAVAMALTVKETPEEVGFQA